MEILIVVVILGVLAAIVIPQFTMAAEGAKQSTFVTNLKSFASAAEIYMNETGQLLEDASTGNVPAGFEDYIRVEDWTGGTPLGGEWDAQQNEMGITSAIGVHFNDGFVPDDAYMAEIDAMIDDGDLTTGGFRKLTSDRFYLILR